MRRRGHGSGCAWAAIFVGGFIMLALILPAWFWWFICAGLLIWGGVWLLRC